MIELAFWDHIDLYAIRRFETYKHPISEIRDIVGYTVTPRPVDGKGSILEAISDIVCHRDRAELVRPKLLFAPTPEELEEVMTVHDRGRIMAIMRHLPIGSDVGFTETSFWVETAAGREAFWHELTGNNPVKDGVFIYDVRIVLCAPASTSS